MEQLLETLRRLGTARLVAMAGVGIGLLAFFVFLAARLSSTEMATLYSDLSQEEAGEVTQALDEQEVRYELQDEGSTVMVPQEQVDQARVQLAQEGLPSGGRIGYEIFDESEGLATSDFLRNVNRLRALEGEMERTISGFDGVGDARVHLVLPRREMFSRERQEPSASVFLQLESGGQPGTEQILAMQRLVAGGVPQLSPEDVSITDEGGTLLSADTGGGSLTEQTPQEMQAQYEQRVARELEGMLGSTLGRDSVRVSVSAEMNFNEVTETVQQYDPDGQVARSEQTIEESETERSSDSVDAVTVAENLPEAESSSEGSQTTNTSESNRTEETTNYEISNTTREVRQAPGQVERLSVGVLVDGTYTTGPNGERQYEPRSEEQLNQIRQVVQSAVGYQEDRGDQVEVVNMQFVDRFAEEAEEPPLLLGLTKDELFRIAETLVLAIVAVLVILLVVRPLIARAFETPVEEEEEEEPEGLITDESGARVGGAAAAEALPGEEEEEEELIDIARVEGQVRASTMRKVGELVEKHPEEAVSILRNWIYQEQS